LRIAADDLGIEFLFIFEYDLNLIGALHHMIVGDDITFFINDESGTQTLLIKFLRALVAEEMIK
jgi:hypothetical protein